MGRMLAVELHKAFCGRWFFISLGLGMVLAALAAFESVYSFELYGFDPQVATLYPYFSSWGCFSVWVGVGSLGHEGLFYLFYFGIVFVAPLAYSWSSVSEFRSGYCNDILSRCSPKQYYFSKLIVTFVAAATVTSAAFLINLVIVACFFPAYTPNAYDSLYTGMDYEVVFAEIFYEAPVLFVFARTAFASAICGLWACVIMALGWYVRNTAVVFLVPYIGLLAVDYLNQSFLATLGSFPLFEFSLFEIIQAWSFVYAHDVRIYCLVAFSLLLMAILLTSGKVKRDVL